MVVFKIKHGMDSTEALCPQWLAKNIGTFFYTSPDRADGATSSVWSKYGKILKEFIDDPSCNVLHAFMKKGDEIEIIAKTLSLEAEASRSLLFIKPKAQQVNADNLDVSVLVISVAAQGSSRSFQAVVSEIFAPLLLRCLVNFCSSDCSREGTELAPSLKILLSDLQSGLAKNQVPTHTETGFHTCTSLLTSCKIVDITSIRSISDEFFFWKDFSHQKKISVS